jgi:hypothetical protein
VIRKCTNKVACVVALTTQQMVPVFGDSSAHLVCSSAVTCLNWYCVRDISLHFLNSRVLLIRSSILLQWIHLKGREVERGII